MKKATLLLECKVWGGISVQDYKQERNYKIAAICLFFLLASLLFLLKINGWAIAVAVIVGSSFLTAFNQLRHTILRLTTHEITISQRKTKRVIKLEEVQFFRFYTNSVTEENDNLTLVAILPWDEISFNLQHMAVIDTRKLLTALYHLGHTIDLPYEELQVQDSTYYIPVKKISNDDRKFTKHL